MAGRHDPQLVPAFSVTPSSSNVVSDSDVIAEMMVFMPTSKQTQTIGPRSGAGLAGRPASRASEDVSSAASSCPISQSRAGKPPERGGESAALSLERKRGGGGK